MFIFTCGHTKQRTLLKLTYFRLSSTKSSLEVFVTNWGQTRMNCLMYMVTCQSQGSTLWILGGMRETFFICCKCISLFVILIKRKKKREWNDKRGWFWSLIEMFFRVGANGDLFQMEISDFSNLEPMVINVTICSCLEMNGTMKYSHNMTCGKELDCPKPEKPVKNSACRTKSKRSARSLFTYLPRTIHHIPKKREVAFLF